MALAACARSLGVQDEGAGSGATGGDGGASAKHTFDGGHTVVTETPISPDAGHGGDGGARLKAHGAGSDGGSSIVTQMPTIPLATGLAIRSMAVFQAVEITVVQGGAHVAQTNAPIVAGRQALIRVYVDPDASYSPHELTGEIDLADAQGNLLGVATDVETVQGSSTEDDVTSSFNFEIPATMLPLGVQFSVSIRDPAGSFDTQGNAIYPAPPQTFDNLGTQSTGSGLKVVLVPVEYDGDGSARMPDMSADQITAYQQQMMAYYPTDNVDVSIRTQPMQTNITVDSQGTGWSDLLQQVVALRQQDAPTPDVYYYAVFEPSDSFADYCANGCMSGLSGTTPDATDATVRASLGLGYTGAPSPVTMAHEIGHAHGLLHAPCGAVATPDPNFPYPNGAIGPWGYDITTDQLVPPDGYNDWMGYCQPTWVSDYNYSLLAQRMQIVNGVPANNASSILGGASFVNPKSIAPSLLPTSAAPMPYRFVSVDKDGALKWGQSMGLHAVPSTPPTRVQYRAADESTVASVNAHYYPYSDMPGGFFLVPETDKSFDHLTVVELPKEVKQQSIRRATLVK